MLGVKQRWFVFWLEVLSGNTGAGGIFGWTGWSRSGNVRAGGMFPSACVWVRKNGFIVPIKVNWIAEIYNEYSSKHDRAMENNKKIDRYKTVIYTNTTSSIIAIIKSMASRGITFGNKETNVNNHFFAPNVYFYVHYLTI